MVLICAMDFDEMVAGDPELQALMKQIHQENPSLLNEVVSTFKADDLVSEISGLLRVGERRRREKKRRRRRDINRARPWTGRSECRRGVPCHLKISDVRGHGHLHTREHLHRQPGGPIQVRSDRPDGGGRVHGAR
jgi:hypothetical protein